MQLQDSLDGQTWRPVWVLGQEVSFETRDAAKAWFKDFEETNRIDYRIGFFLRCSDGRFFRLVHKNGKEVAYRG